MKKERITRSCTISKKGKYNILYLVSTLASEGPNKQQYYIFKYINKDFFNPLVLTLSPERSNSIIDAFHELGIPVDSLGLSRFKGYFFARRMIKEFIYRNQIDLIHSFGIRADDLAFNIDIPNLSSLRNYPYIEYPSLYKYFFGYYLANKHLRIIKKKKNNIVCSSSLAHHYLRKNNLELEVIHNGIDTNIYNKNNFTLADKKNNREKYGLLLNSVVFLSASNLIPRKNIKIIIEVFINYFFNDEKYSLIIAGDGPDRDKLEKMAIKSKNIIFIGKSKNMVEVYNTSDYFISASVGEGLPNSVLEAMSCGLPCILSNISPHLEIIDEKNEGLIKIFDPYKIDDLYNQILIMKSLIDYKKISNQCSDHIKNNFNALTTSYKYQEKYKKILYNN